MTSLANVGARLATGDNSGRSLSTVDQQAEAKETAEARVAALAQQHVAAAISALADIAKDGDAPASARVAAANALLDRAAGKPKQTAEVKQTADLNAMHLEALRAMSAQAQVAANSHAGKVIDHDPR